MMDSLNDLSNYRTVGLMGRLMKQGKRWETTPEIRSRAIGLIADVVEDEGENVANRLKAVDLLLKCEAQNIILILPSNGSEQSDTIESQEDGA
jgi:hypothetical protein